MTLVLCLALCGQLGAAYEPPEVVAEIRRTWPESDSSLLSELRDDPRVVFYTPRTMPRLVQSFGYNYGQVPGYRGHAAYSTESLNLGEPRDSGDDVFPWKATAGMHGSGGDVVTFARLAGPAVFWEREAHQDEPVRIAFAPGTIFGEILRQRFSDGTTLPFEVRLRIKKASGDWRYVVMKPFPDPESERRAVERIWPDFAGRPDLAARVAHHQSGGRPVVRALGDFLAAERYPASPTARAFGLAPGERPYNRPASDPAPFRGAAADDAADSAAALKLFGRLAAVDEPPPLAAEHAKRLLREPFRDAAGSTWAVDDAGVPGYSPYASVPDQTVPVGYTGAYFAPTAADCRTCHARVGETYADLMQVPGVSRGWSGMFGVGDETVTFNPIDPRTVYRPTPETARDNRPEVVDVRPAPDPRLVRAGLIDLRVDPSRMDSAFTGR